MFMYFLPLNKSKIVLCLLKFGWKHNYVYVFSSQGLPLIIQNSSDIPKIQIKTLCLCIFFLWKCPEIVMWFQRFSWKHFMFMVFLPMNKLKNSSMIPKISVENICLCIFFLWICPEIVLWSLKFSWKHDMFICFLVRKMLENNSIRQRVCKVNTNVGSCLSSLYFIFMTKICCFILWWMWIDYSKWLPEV